MMTWILLISTFICIGFAWTRMDASDALFVTMGLSMMLMIVGFYQEDMKEKAEERSQAKMVQQVKAAEERQEQQTRQEQSEKKMKVMEEAWEDKEFSEEELNLFSEVDATTDTNVMDVLLDLERNPELKTANHRYETLLKEIRSSPNRHLTVSNDSEDK